MAVQGTDSKAATGRSSKSRPIQLVVCLPLDEAVHVVHLRRGRTGVEERILRITPADPWKGASKGRGRCPVVAILPKSLYLVRTLELPRVDSADVPQMLKLEVNAQLPPEFGAAEVSYRPLSRCDEGNPRYESYVARREALNEYLSRLREVGIQPDLILPSCVAWALLLEVTEAADLLVASMGSGQLEAASQLADGATSIRTIVADNSGARGETLQRSLIEYVRTLRMQTTLHDEAVSIGWLGNACPSHLANGRIRFRDVAEVLPGLRWTESHAHEVDVTLRCFAEALLAAGEESTLQTSNLLPGDVLARQQQQAVRRLTVSGGLLVLLACVLTGVALKIASHRYQSRMADMSMRMGLIRREGESVGRRLEQLQAVQAIRATNNDFTRVIAGLCESAPQGLSYSSIEMDDEGRLRLQGQADSLAMAFLLPEQLEKQGGFVEVQPGDAARSRKGEGTLAEFRVNCRLSGRGAIEEKPGASLRSEPGIKAAPGRKEGR